MEIPRFAARLGRLTAVGALMAGFATAGPLLTGCCDPCEGHPDDPMCLPEDPKKFVTVQVIGALIGPGTYSHEPWDADGTQISTETWQKLAAALSSTNPYLAASALVVNPVLAGTKAPDPFGTARLDIGQGIGTTYELANNSNNPEDTYLPVWPGLAVWQHVPIEESLRLQVKIEDEDLINHDGIGVAEITKQDLLDALASGQTYQVPVARQTNDQLLFIGISVRQ
jgi:hypothetical protein